MGRMECCQQIIHNFFSCGHMDTKFSENRQNRIKLKVNKFNAILFPEKNDTCKILIVGTGINFGPLLLS